MQHVHKFYVWWYIKSFRFCYYYQLYPALHWAVIWVIALIRWIQIKQKGYSILLGQRNINLTPPSSFFVRFDHLPVNQWIPRLVLTECLFERRENIPQVLMIRDSSVWTEYKISLSSSCSNIARSAWVWQIIRGCMITDKQLFFSLLWFSVRKNQKENELLKSCLWELSVRCQNILCKQE